MAKTETYDFRLMFLLSSRDDTRRMDRRRQGHARHRGRSGRLTGQRVTVTPEPGCFAASREISRRAGSCVACARQHLVTSPRVLADDAVRFKTMQPMDRRSAAR